MSEKDATDMKERLVRIETLLTGIDEKIKLKQENTDEKFKVANHRISDLEGDVKWLWRTTIGAVIVAAIGFFFNLKK